MHTSRPSLRAAWGNVRALERPDVRTLAYKILFINVSIFSDKKAMIDAAGLIARIEQRLAALGLSPRAACLEAGVSENWLNGLRKNIAEGKRHNPRIDTIRALARALHTTLEWLIDGTGPEVVMPEDSPHATRRTKRTKKPGHDIESADAVVEAIFSIGEEIGLQITPTIIAHIARDPRIVIDVEAYDEVEYAKAILRLRIRRRLLAMK